MGAGCDRSTGQQSLTILPPVNGELIDPIGQVTGCAGELLADYRGFSVALYDPDPQDPTGASIHSLSSLTTTELPDDSDNTIPQGVVPNIENSNPFYLTNSDRGQYSFLFDSERGQVDTGRTYILLVDPPEDSIYSQRRVKLVLGDHNNDRVRYTATSLDGRPISAVDGQNTITGEIVLVRDAERVGLSLAVLDLATNICEAQEIEITKSGDHAAAAPGDTVIYRLAIRNLTQTDLTNLNIRDVLPARFKFEDKAVKGEIEGQAVAIVAQPDGRTINFTTDALLPSGKTLILVYAAQLTPDAVRGEGENSAIVNGQRIDNNFTVKDGPAIHRIRVEPGILSDSGTIIGRVFIDQNFDGKQQTGEAGIPNAVIFLEDGNRIITDPNGLFSVTNVLPGYHTGILDLTSIPGYTLAPNILFKERNSKSRLVHLEPSGMVRMNFGVMSNTEVQKETSTTPKEEFEQ